VNTKLDTQIQALLNTINKEWLDDLKGWWHVLFRRWGLEKEKKKFKNIKISIKLDCILENVNGQLVLILDPTEVKRRTQQHFQTQYQNRKTSNEKVTKNWEQIYAPKEEIKDE
ncbi:12726_t:CDS:2, partial [Gigaspora margarita]